MVRLIGGVLTLLAIPFALAAQPGAGGTNADSPFAAWVLERDVDAPSYAVIEPASTDLNIDSLVLSCEQGPQRRGLQLRLHLSGGGALAPVGDPAATLKDDPTVELAIDGVSHAAQLLFADDFVVVADSADGVMPLLSHALLDALQRGRRMELRFHLVQAAQGQTPAVDGTAVINLQAGRGGTAVAAVRRCAGEPHPQVAEKAGRGR
jgi:hypothetical protein